MKRGPTLPSVVVLPTIERLDHWTVTTALGVSRQRLFLWRRDHGFPPSMRDGRGSFTNAAAVASWLSGRNVAVRWI